MRLDHIAYRVANRYRAIEFFISAFGYRIAEEFRIDFDAGECARCFALLPPEAYQKSILEAPWYRVHHQMSSHIFHLAPEIFVSDGSPNSIVGKWVAARGGIGGIHHLAYEVEDVKESMKEWTRKGWGQFTTTEPISNEAGLIQCFTNPHPVTGVVYELIKRGDDNKGFNVDNVRDLMESTI